MELIFLRITVLLIAISQVCIIFLVHDMYKDIQALREYQRIPKTPPKAKIKPTEQTDEQRQYNTLMSNIDNYNGTGAKQEKVR